MKNVLLVSLVLAALQVNAQNNKSVPAKKSTAQTPGSATVLKTATDSLSYAIGVLDGTFFKTQGIRNINAQVLGKGFSDVINGKPACSPEVANEIVRREMQRINQARVQPNIDEGAKFLAENRKKPGITVTASGMQYKVIKMSDGPKPAETSTLKVHYEGFLLNGRKIDSSRDRGEPYTFKLTDMVRGWIEGLQLMPLGSRFKFYIPYTMGYGLQGSGETIPGGSALIFDVELLEIIQNN